MERFLCPNSLEVQNQKRHILHARGGTIVFSRAEISLKSAKNVVFFILRNANGGIWGKGILALFNC